MNEIKLTVRPFLMGADKEAAVKVLEEAAEAFGSWQTLDVGLENDLNTDDELRWLADEIADCVQACCNLADRYGIDLQAAMVRCEERNRKRGRYQ